MLNFVETITKAIHDYKKILKRKLPQQQYSAKLQDLSIKRLQLRDLSEPYLLLVARDILQELEDDYNNAVYPKLYSGIIEFKNYLKGLVESHRIENNKVVNISQKASSLIIQSAHILSNLQTNINDSDLKALEEHIDGLIQYGSPTQINMILSAIKKQELEKTPIGARILQKLQNHIESNISNAEAVTS
ncbi:MAG: hypothetical protein WCW01_02760 [Gammaproteobacteria bacterium]|jgi:hypothetical protein